MFRFISDRVAEQVEHGIKMGLAPLGAFLRRMASGFLLILVSVFFWILGLTFLALSLFFELSGLLTYVAPALYVCLIASLLGLLVFMFGSLMLRRPRY